MALPYGVKPSLPGKSNPDEVTIYIVWNLVYLSEWFSNGNLVGVPASFGAVGVFERIE